VVYHLTGKIFICEKLRILAIHIEYKYNFSIADINDIPPISVWRAYKSVAGQIALGICYISMTYSIFFFKIGFCFVKTTLPLNSLNIDFGVSFL
jgi:hypothetical protein